MRKTSLPFATFLCVVQLTCVAGCQFAGYSWGRRTEVPLEPSSRVEPLSERQIGDVHLSLARSLELQGQSEQATKAYRELIAKFPQQPTAYWRLAVLYDRQGRHQESEPLYKQALQLDRQNAELHCDYGYSLYLQRRWAESEERLRQSIAIQPANARAHNNFGLLFAQREQFDLALAAFYQAGISESDAYANLAFVSMLNRNWDQARAQYNLALGFNPHSAVAQAGIVKLETFVAKSTLATETDTSFISLAGATMTETLIFPSPR